MSSVELIFQLHVDSSRDEWANALQVAVDTFLLKFGGSVRNSHSRILPPQYASQTFDLVVGTRSLRTAFHISVFLQLLDESVYANAIMLPFLNGGRVVETTAQHDILTSRLDRVQGDWRDLQWETDDAGEWQSYSTLKYDRQG